MKNWLIGERSPLKLTVKHLINSLINAGFFYGIIITLKYPTQSPNASLSSLSSTTTTAGKKMYDYTVLECKIIHFQSVSHVSAAIKKYKPFSLHEHA